MYAYFQFFSTFLLYNIFELTTWRKFRYLSTCPTEMLKCASMGVSIYVPVRSKKCSALAVFLSCSILWTMHYPQYCIPVSIHYRIKSAVARLWQFWADNIRLISAPVFCYLTIVLSVCFGVSCIRFLTHTNLDPS